MVNNSTNINNDISHQIIEHKKEPWENHINKYATFVDDDNIDNSHTYEKVPYQSPRDNIPNGMYDLILHLA
jgi:hypothetical protein